MSKTDLKGRITYANDVFLRVSGYSEREILGAPHSTVRHPDMPASVFHLLWETIQSGNEIFAYVVNLAKNGDHYWVFAHVTPTLDASGRISGYHSNRRSPDRAAVRRIEQVYAELRAVEQRSSDRAAGIRAARAALAQKLEAAGVSYGEFAFNV